MAGRPLLPDWAMGRGANPALSLCSPLLAGSFCLLDQFVDGFVNDVVTGTAEPPVADHALMIEQVQRRRSRHFPRLTDWALLAALAAVSKRTPTEILPNHHL